MIRNVKRRLRKHHLTLQHSRDIAPGRAVLAVEPAPVHSTPPLIILVLRGMKRSGQKGWSGVEVRAQPSDRPAGAGVPLSLQLQWKPLPQWWGARRKEGGERWAGGKQGRKVQMMCVKYTLWAKIHLFSSIFRTDTNQIYRAQVLFYGGLLSIVSLEVFAEACDLGQGLREAINNSEHEGAVFRANFEKLCHFFNRQGRKEPERHQIRTARWASGGLVHVCFAQIHRE